MAMPPVNIDSEDLWAILTSLPKAHRVIESPLKMPDGTNAPIAIMVLTQEENQQCVIAAEAFTRKMLKEIPKKDDMSQGYKDLFDTRAAAEILYRACYRHNDLNKKFFPTVDAINKKLTIDQISVLYAQYMIVQAEIGPIVAEMSQEELDAWTAKIAEGGSAHFLGFLTSAAQSQLIVSMARQLLTLQTDKCSATSSPDKSIKKDSNEVNQM